MTRLPDVTAEWCEALLAWIHDGEPEALIELMQDRLDGGQSPFTNDEFGLLKVQLRRAKFTKPRGRQPDVNVVGAAIIHAHFSEGLKTLALRPAQLKAAGLRRSELAFDATMRWAEQNGCVPDPEKLKNYLKRSKKSRRSLPR